MDIHKECRIRQYMFHIQKIAGPLSLDQLEQFKDLSELQDIRISGADAERVLADIKTKNWNNNKVTNTVSYNTWVTPCIHNVSHETEADRFLKATRILQELLPKYICQHHKAVEQQETKPVDENLNTVDVTKLKELMRRAVERLPDSSVVNIEEFMRLCLEEFDAENHEVKNNTQAWDSHRQVSTEKELYDEAFEERMTSVVVATINACRRRLDKIERTQLAFKPTPKLNQHKEQTIDLYELLEPHETVPEPTMNLTQSTQTETNHQEIQTKSTQTEENNHQGIHENKPMKKVDKVKMQQPDKVNRKHKKILTTSDLSHSTYSSYWSKSMSSDGSFRQWLNDRGVKNYKTEENLDKGMKTSGAESTLSMGSSFESFINKQMNRTETWVDDTKSETERKGFRKFGSEISDTTVQSDFSPASTCTTNWTSITQRMMKALATNPPPAEISHQDMNVQQLDHQKIPHEDRICPKPKTNTYNLSIELPDIQEEPSHTKVTQETFSWSDVLVFSREGNSIHIPAATIADEGIREHPNVRRTGSNTSCLSSDGYTPSWCESDNSTGNKVDASILEKDVQRGSYEPPLIKVTVNNSRPSETVPKRVPSSQQKVIYKEEDTYESGSDTEIPTLVKMYGHNSARKDDVVGPSVTKRSEFVANTGSTLDVERDVCWEEELQLMDANNKRETPVNIGKKQNVVWQNGKPRGDNNKETKTCPQGNKSGTGIGHASISSLEAVAGEEVDTLSVESTYGSWRSDGQEYDESKERFRDAAYKKGELIVPEDIPAQFLPGPNELRQIQAGIEIKRESFDDKKKIPKQKSPSSQPALKEKLHPQPDEMTKSEISLPDRPKESSKTGKGEHISGQSEVKANALEIKICLEINQNGYQLQKQEPSDNQEQNQVYMTTMISDLKQEIQKLCFNDKAQSKIDEKVEKAKKEKPCCNDEIQSKIDEKVVEKTKKVKPCSNDEVDENVGKAKKEKPSSNDEVQSKIDEKVEKAKKQKPCSNDEVHFKIDEKVEKAKKEKPSSNDEVQSKIDEEVKTAKKENPCSNNEVQSKMDEKVEKAKKQKPCSNDEVQSKIDEKVEKAKKEKPCSNNEVQSKMEEKVEKTKKQKPRPNDKVQSKIDEKVEKAKKEKPCSNDEIQSKMEEKVEKAKKQKPCSNNEVQSKIDEKVEKTKKQKPRSNDKVQSKIDEKVEKAKKEKPCSNDEVQSKMEEKVEKAKKQKPCSNDEAHSKIDEKVEKAKKQKPCSNDKAHSKNDEQVEKAKKQKPSSNEKAQPKTDEKVEKVKVQTNNYERASESSSDSDEEVEHGETCEKAALCQETAEVLLHTRADGNTIKDTTKLKETVTGAFNIHADESQTKDFTKLKYDEIRKQSSNDQQAKVFVKETIEENVSRLQNEKTTVNKEIEIERKIVKSDEKEEEDEYTSDSDEDENKGLANECSNYKTTKTNKKIQNKTLSKQKAAKPEEAIFNTGLGISDTHGHNDPEDNDAQSDGTEWDSDGGESDKGDGMRAEGTKSERAPQNIQSHGSVQGKSAKKEIPVHTIRTEGTKVEHAPQNVQSHGSVQGKSPKKDIPVHTMEAEGAKKKHTPQNVRSPGSVQGQSPKIDISDHTIESVVINKEAKNEESNLQYDSDLSTGTPRFIRIQRQEQQDKLNQGTRNQDDNNTTGSRNLKASENNAKPKDSSVGTENQKVYNYDTEKQPNETEILYNGALVIKDGGYDYETSDEDSVMDMPPDEREKWLARRVAQCDTRDHQALDVDFLNLDEMIAANTPSGVNRELAKAQFLAVIAEKSYVESIEPELNNETELYYQTNTQHKNTSQLEEAKITCGNMVARAENRVARPDPFKKQALAPIRPQSSNIQPDLQLSNPNDKPLPKPKTLGSLPTMNDVVNPQHENTFSQPTAINPTREEAKIDYGNMVDHAENRVARPDPFKKQALAPIRPQSSNIQPDLQLSSPNVKPLPKPKTLGSLPTMNDVVNPQHENTFSKSNAIHLAQGEAKLEYDNMVAHADNVVAHANPVINPLKQKALAPIGSQSSNIQPDLQLSNPNYQPLPKPKTLGPLPPMNDVVGKPLQRQGSLKPLAPLNAPTEKVKSPKKGDKKSKKKDKKEKAKHKETAPEPKIFSVTESFPTPSYDEDNHAGMLRMGGRTNLRERMMPNRMAPLNTGTLRSAESQFVPRSMAEGHAHDQYDKFNYRSATRTVGRMEDDFIANPYHSDRMMPNRMAPLNTGTLHSAESQFVPRSMAEGHAHDQYDKFNYRSATRTVGRMEDDFIANPYHSSEYDVLTRSRPHNEVDVGRNGVGHLGHLGQLGHTGHQGHLGHLGQAGHLDQIGQPGQLGHIGHLGQAGHLDQIGQPGQLGHIGHLGQTGHLDQIGQPGHLGHIGHLGQTGHLDPIGQPGHLGHIGHLGQTGHQDQIGQPGLLREASHFPTRKVLPSLRPQQRPMEMMPNQREHLAPLTLKRGMR